MSYTEVTYYETGSYISGTTDNYSSGSVYTVFYAPPTFKYNGNIILNMLSLDVPGPSGHAGKPTIL